MPSRATDLPGFARRHPGVLLDRALQEMQRYLTPLGGAAGNDPEPGKINQYLLSVFFQRHSQEAIGLRTCRELRTLAECLDALLAGNLPRVGDILIQRFKALETSVADGGWTIARHLELLPQAEVGLSTDRERAIATRAELDRVKLAEAASRTRSRAAER